MDSVFINEMSKANIKRAERDSTQTGLRKRIIFGSNNKDKNKKDKSKKEVKEEVESEEESDESEDSKNRSSALPERGKQTEPEKVKKDIKDGKKIKDRKIKLEEIKIIMKKEKPSIKRQKSFESSNKNNIQKEDEKEEKEEKLGERVKRRKMNEDKADEFRKMKIYERLLKALQKNHENKNIKNKKKENQEIKEEKEIEEEKEEESGKEMDEIEDFSEKEVINSEIEDQIQNEIFKRIKDLREKRKKGVPMKDPLFWEDKKSRKIYLKYLKSLEDDEIIMDIDNIYVQPSKSVVNGVLYETPGFTLDEISRDSEEIMRFLNGYNKYGFELPARLVEFCSGYKPYSFTLMLREYPYLFQSFGSPFGSTAVLKKPSKLKSLGVITDSRVAIGELGKMLGNVPKDYSDVKNNEELRSLFYLDIDEIHLEKVSPNVEKVMDFYDRAVEKNKNEIEENNKELEKCCSDPKKYFSEQIPDLEIYHDKKVIVLINENQHVRKMTFKEVAKTIRTRFTFGGPDLSMCFLAANFVASEIPDNVLNLLIDNYIGTGGVKMLGERYQASYKIYKESNSEENKKFHKKWYKENFVPMLNEFGYVYTGPKIGIPKDYEEYSEILDYRGAKLNHVNPHSKGTFTSFKKRIFTGAKEIEAGLRHWRDLTNNPADKNFQFFYIGFKNICAKLKDEIHSYEKPPRFYNPTFIAAFIPFQLVFNKVFEKCIPLSEKCPHSLLGIKDIDHNFSDLMNKIYKEENLMYHYSDNFWIKEGDLYMSVDVKRCDSNLSAEALYYPMKVFGKMVLDDDTYEKYSILCDMFVQLIPRGAVFSFANKLYKQQKEEIEKNSKKRRKAFNQIKRKKKYNKKEEESEDSDDEEKEKEEEEPVADEFINMLMPFYWLPSGMVGTAYINHMFTGAFLYYTRENYWIDTKTNKLSQEILDKAQKFGIHLEVASFYDFSKLKEGEIVPFDLLGRSGKYIQGTFVPLLEESRVWKTLFFIKKKKYDISSKVGNFVRLAKLDSLIQLGGLLYPVARELIFSALVAYSSFLRKNLVDLTREQGESLIETLDRFNIDPVAYEGFIFKGFLPNVKEYIYQKTGLKISDKDIDSFDEKLAEKFDNYYTVWSSLLPVIQGVETSHVHYDHNQYTTQPYNVMHYFKDLLMRKKEKKTITINALGRYLIEYFGQSLGASIFSAFLDLFISEGNLILKEFKKEFKRKGKEFAKHKIEKGMKPFEAKKYVDDLVKRTFRTGMKTKDTFEFLIEKDKKDREYIYLVPYEDADRGTEVILNRIDITPLLDRKSPLWYLLERGELGMRINYLMSKIMFDGYKPKEVREKKLASVQLPIVKKYRFFPYEIDSMIIFNPSRMKMENDKMILNERKPVANDLGYLTGTLSNPAKGVKILELSEKEIKEKELSIDSNDDEIADEVKEEIKEKRRKKKKEKEIEEEKEEERKEKEEKEKKKKKKIEKKLRERTKKKEK